MCTHFRGIWTWISGLEVSTLRVSTKLCKFPCSEVPFIGLSQTLHVPSTCAFSSARYEPGPRVSRWARYAEGRQNYLHIHVVKCPFCRPVTNSPCALTSAGYEPGSRVSRWVCYKESRQNCLHIHVVQCPLLGLSQTLHVPSTYALTAMLRGRTRNTQGCMVTVFLLKALINIYFLG